MKKLLITGLFAMLLLVSAVLGTVLIQTSSGQDKFTVKENETASVGFTITTGGTATLSKNVSFGSLSATSGLTNGATPTFTWRPDYTESGSYSINFSIDNGSNSSFTLVTINVTDVAPGLKGPGSITFGDTNQKRSNPLHDDADKREVNLTQSFTITNDGGRALSSLSFSPSAVGGLSASNLKVNVTFGKTSLAIGESATATMTIRIPESMDSVNSNLVPTAVQVATVTITSSDGAGNTTTTAVPVSMRAKNMLEINDAKIVVNGNRKDFKDGNRVKDLKPDDKIDVEVEAENLFKDRENVDLEDVEARLEVDGLDIDETEDFGTLKPGEKDSVTISFQLDDDVDDGTYSGTLTLEGTDENGAKHGERWSVEFRVDRKTHEIAIRSASISPSSVRCEPTAELVVSIRNIGQRDEDAVTIHVESPELNHGDVTNFIDLSENDQVTKRFTLPVPQNLANGAHRVMITTYYDSSIKSDEEVVFLNKESCVTGEETPAQPPKEVPKEEQKPAVVVTPPEKPKDETTGNVVAQLPVVVTEQKPFTQTSSYVALLVLAYIVVIGGGIFMASQLLRRKP